MGVLSGIFGGKAEGHRSEMFHLTEVDELQITSMAENIVKAAVYNVNPQAEVETRTGLEPRYYLKLEIKIALREFEKMHSIHLCHYAKQKANNCGHTLCDYIHHYFVTLIEPHFEGGEGENKIHPATYIHYLGDETVTAQFPQTLENALKAYQNSEALSGDENTPPQQPNNQGKIEPRLH